jgi:hypothetical protein
VYKSWSSSLCSLHQPLVTSSLLRSNTLLHTFSSKMFSLCYSHNVTDQVHIHTKQHVKLRLIYFNLHLSRRKIMDHMGVRLHVNWFHCHHGMARPQVADRGDCLQIWRVAVNMLNRQSRTADRGWRID